ncbi:hypothetical protein [Streptomyces celluloflavus]|uniref:hypothetical protein n=1 Tax=Streptomyces celluloflavus TaxID=58344 RepID=UPI00365DE0E0
MGVEFLDRPGGACCEKRDVKAAKGFMAKLMKEQQHVPRVLVTDKANVRRRFRAR